MKETIKSVHRRKKKQTRLKRYTTPKQAGMLIERVSTTTTTLKQKGKATLSKEGAVDTVFPKRLTFVCLRVLSIILKLQTCNFC